MNCSFTLEHYLECIYKAQDEGYTIKRVCDYSDDKSFHKQMGWIKDKVILLRHDIDFSLENALELAKLEYQVGVKSSYYVYLHSELYNALSPKGMEMIRQIQKMGHEIGLHYDSKHDIGAEDWIIDGIIPEDYNIQTVTQHFPSSNKKINFEHLLDPTDLKLKYISDSGRNWREGCMCENIGKHKKLHINTHAEWWVSKSSDRWTAINNMYQSYESILARNMQQVRDMLKEYEKTI
jgi:hypothetical protein